MNSNDRTMLLFISVLSVFLLAAPAASQDLPQFPMILYGNIQVNGESVPSGTIIFAYAIDDTRLGSTQVEEAGEYGDIALNRLVINEPPGPDDQIHIYIQTPSMSSAVEAQQTIKWDSGKVKQLDLTAVYVEESTGGKNLKTSDGGSSHRITTAGAQVVEEESVAGGGSGEYFEFGQEENQTDEVPSSTSTSSKLGITLLQLAVSVIAILGALYYFKTKNH